MGIPWHLFVTAKSQCTATDDYHTLLQLTSCVGPRVVQVEVAALETVNCICEPATADQDWRFHIYPKNFNFGSSFIAAAMPGTDFIVTGKGSGVY